MQPRLIDVSSVPEALDAVHEGAMELAAVRIDNSRVPEDPSSTLEETLEAAPVSLLVGAAAVARSQSEENYVASDL